MKLLDILHILTGIYFLYTPLVNLFINNNITLKTSSTTTKTTTTATTIFHKIKSNDNANIINSNQKNVRSTNTAVEKGLSACLLVKDENHNLIEWIAYHYHTLPLKHLVIAIDPNSRTLPHSILQRWTNNTRIYITIWNDEDFFMKRMSGKLPWNASTYEHVNRHRMRQAMFITKCLTYYKKIDIDWVVLIDTDEYLTLNPVTKEDLVDKHNEKRDNFHLLPTQQEEDKDVDIVSLKKGRFLYKQTTTNSDNNISMLEHHQEQLLEARTYIPPPMEVYHKNITVEAFIRNHTLDVPWVNQSCILIARTLFSAVEESNELKLQNMIPNGFNPLDFNTLRFFRHGGLNNIHRNRMGKAILDVSRISFEQLRGRASSPHIPISSICHGNFFHHLSMLRVHHYSGTYEAFMSKSDKRREDKMYKGRSQGNRAVTYDLKPWLYGFVESVGYDVAKRLLDGVGKVVQNRHPEDEKNR